jgi:tetratricopeptide (TPR) repeat protein
MLGMALYMGNEDIPKAEVQAKNMLAVSESRTGKTSEHTADTLSLVADFYQEAGLDEKAEAPALRALAIYEKDPKADKDQIGSLLMAVGAAQTANHRWLEAIPTINRIRELAGPLSDPPSSSACALMLMQARALSSVGKVIEAEQLSRTAWTVLKRQKGLDYRLTISAQRGQAAMLGFLGRAVEGHALLAELLERSLVEPTSETIELLDQSAGLVRIRGDVAAEEKLLIQARALAEKLRKGKPLPPDTTETLAHMEEEYQESLGHWPQAEKLLRAQMTLDTAKAPNSHAHAWDRLSLAGILQEQRRYDEALVLCRDARVSIEKGFGAGSLGGLAYLATVADISLDRGQVAEAEPFVLAAQRTAIAIYGKDNIAALANINLLVADLRRRQGRPADALPLATVATEGLTKMLGVSDMPGNSGALLVLADINRDLGTAASLKAAEAGYAQVLAIREGKLNADNPKIATALEHYAEYLRKVKHDGEAATCEARAKKIRGT